MTVHHLGWRRIGPSWIPIFAEPTAATNSPAAVVRPGGDSYAPPPGCRSDGSLIHNERVNTL